MDKSKCTVQLWKLLTPYILAIFTHVTGIPATFHGIIYLRTRRFGDISVYMTHFLIVHNYVSPSSRN